MKLLTLLLVPCISNAGMFLDKPTEHNTSYLEVRYLNHTTGRFISQDIKQQYASHYGYGVGRLILLSDPTGMMWEQQLEEDAVNIVTSTTGDGGLYNEDLVKVSPQEKSVKSEHKNKDKNSVITSTDSGKEGITGEFIDLFNRTKAREFLSMRKVTEMQIRELIENNLVKDISQEKIEELVRTNTDEEMLDYLDVRRKRATGEATLREIGALENHYRKLNLNTEFNNPRIGMLGRLAFNSKDYDEMLNVLIEHFKDSTIFKRGDAEYGISK